MQFGRPHLANKKAELAGFVLEHKPACNSAWVVGSASTRDSDSIADIDINAFDDSVALGSEFSVDVEWAIPVSIQYYNTEHFAAIALNTQLVFYYLREIRKLRNGYPIIQSQTSRRLERELGQIEIPFEYLRPIAVRAVNSVRQLDSQIDFLFGLENLIFVWMNCSWDYRFSKPKYLLDDVQSIDSKCLIALIDTVSEDAARNVDVRALVKRLADHVDLAISKSERRKMLHLRDAKKLTSLNQTERALWPLRMAMYMYISRLAKAEGLDHRDLRDIPVSVDDLEPKYPGLRRLTEEIVAPNEPVSAERSQLMNAAVYDFARDWNCRVEGSAARDSLTVCVSGDGV